MILALKLSVLSNTIVLAPLACFCQTVFKMVVQGNWVLHMTGTVQEMCLFLYYSNLQLYYYAINYNVLLITIINYFIIVIGLQNRQ